MHNGLHIKLIWISSRTHFFVLYNCDIFWYVIINEIVPWLQYNQPECVWCRPFSLSFLRLVFMFPNYSKMEITILSHSILTITLIYFHNCVFAAWWHMLLPTICAKFGEANDCHTWGKELKENGCWRAFRYFCTINLIDKHSFTLKHGFSAAIFMF